MEFEYEYDLYGDYLKVIEPIENFDLSEECLTKLKELGIKRAGEILACSDVAISNYGENAELIKDAKNAIELQCGELDVWELLWDIEEYEKVNEEIYEAFSVADEDDPLDLMYTIVSAALLEYLYEYKRTNGKGLKLSDTPLPQEIKDKLENENSLIMFFILSAKEIATSELSYDEVNQVRECLVDLLPIHKEIFVFLDELAELKEKRYKELLKEKGYSIE